MKFCNPSEGGLVWPAESVTHTHSADGALLDTGWLINWPGPGQVYLSDGDIIDVVVPAAKERAAVQEALKTAGWTAPGEIGAHESALAKLEEKLAQAYEKIAAYHTLLGAHGDEVAAVDAKAEAPDFESMTGDELDAYAEQHEVADYVKSAKVAEKKKLLEDSVKS